MNIFIFKTELGLKFQILASSKEEALEIITKRFPHAGEWKLNEICGKCSNNIFSLPKIK